MGIKLQCSAFDSEELSLQTGLASKPNEVNSSSSKPSFKKPLRLYPSTQWHAVLTFNCLLQ